MKLKITSIEKTYEPFKMKNGGLLYAYGVKLEDGTWAKIVTYTDKLAITSGLELSQGDNCENIKEEVKTYMGKDGQENSYKQFTVYAKKKEGGWNKGGGGFQKIDMDKYSHAIKVSHELALTMSNNTDELTVRYFEILLGNMLDHVEFAKDTAGKIEAVFENPFSDDVPF